MLNVLPNVSANEQSISEVDKLTPSLSGLSGEGQSQPRLESKARTQPALDGVKTRSASKTESGDTTTFFSRLTGLQPD